MPTNTEVKVFKSTDSGAPALSGTAGTLIAVLDACLQNGYGDVTLDSVVIASNVATCTKSTGHGFAMIGNVGPVIRISGATPAGLNGDWRITVVSTTQFTFATTGISDQTATGTIVAKRAPAGFTKEFSGTNLAAYRSDDMTGTRLYLRVDDTATNFPPVAMYEDMTDANTGTLSYSAYTMKSDTADAVARAWTIIADTRCFYLIVTTGDSTYYESGLFFGEFVSYKSGDAYHCALIAGSTSEVSNIALGRLLDNTYHAIARSYTQVGSAVNFENYSHAKNVSFIGYYGSTYPNAVDNSFHAWPVEIWESDAVARGLMPGLWNPNHDKDTLPDNTVIDAIIGLPGRSLMVVRMATALVSFDIVGPWR